MATDSTKSIYDVKGPMDAAQSCKVSNICSLAMAGMKEKEKSEAAEARKTELENEISSLKEDWKKATKPEQKLEILSRLDESLKVKEVERDLGIERQKLMNFQALLSARDAQINDLRKELAQKRSLYEAEPELQRMEHRIKVLSVELKEKEVELALKQSNIAALDDHARYLTDKIENDRDICKDIYKQVEEKRKEMAHLERRLRRVSPPVEKPNGRGRSGRARGNPLKRFWERIRNRGY